MSLIQIFQDAGKFTIQQKGPTDKQKLPGAQNFKKSLELNGAYGKGNRPSTPVKGIISGEYGNMAADEINTKYEYAAANKKN